MSVAIGSKGLQALNVIAVVATIVVNALANIVPFNGRYTGEIADYFFNYFTPAGYVFSIWGVIYVLLIAFMLFQVRASQREANYLRQIGPLYLIAAVANIVWLVMFHYSYGNDLLFVFTIIPIVGLLLTLIVIYNRLGVGRILVSRNERLAVQLPVSVYLGWISVATIANTASVLNVLVPGITLSAQHVTTGVMVLVALVLTFLMLYQRHDYAFGLVFAWASVGIGIKHSSILVISYTAIGAAVVAVLLIVLLPVVMRKNILDFYMLRS
ncbi:MAG: tryptophan-rich sensory protein [Candidatus Thorarchaeota archaeon]